MYRGATTSGNRNVTSPSWYGSGWASVSRTVTRSPGAMLPTRIVNTSGRSSSAIATAVRRDRLVVLRPGLGTLLQHPFHDMPAASIRIAVTAARSGSGKM